MPDEDASGQQIHISLVLNGGVSLAVWISGVVTELDRLRRGEGAWSGILGGGAVHVDLIAGTSAGGLNGALLADAIASEAALPDLRDLWLEAARLDQGHLLRGKPRYLFSGAYFQEEVARQFPDRGDATGTGDVTLLLTATAVANSTARISDDAGQELTATDHRRVFRFRHQPKRYWMTHDELEHKPARDFQDSRAALARAARASAGYPVAFEPVPETADLHALRVLGKGPPGWLMDGGVLDNAPFGPLMDELEARPRRLPGDRWVVYVVPGASEHAVPPVYPQEGPALAETLGRFFTTSREPDARGDLELIEDFREESAAVVAQPAQLLGKAANNDRTRSLWSTYRQTRAEQLVVEFLHSLRSGRADHANELRNEGFLEQVLQAELIWVPPNFDPPLESWQWGVGAAVRMSEWLLVRTRATGDADEVADLAYETALKLRAIQSRLAELEGPLLTAQVSAPHPLVMLAFMQASSATYADSGLMIKVRELMGELVSAWADHECQGNESEAWSRLFGVEVLRNCATWQTSDPPPPFSFYMVSPDVDYTNTGIDLSGDPSLTDSPGWPNSKLYGTRWNHFAAFGHSSWREWDFQMGRLDGAITLARRVLDARGVLPEQQEPYIRELVAEIAPNPSLVASGICATARTTARELLRVASRESDFGLLLERASAIVSSNTPATGWTRPITRALTWFGKKAAERKLRKLLAETG